MILEAYYNGFIGHICHKQIRKRTSGNPRSLSFSQDRDSDELWQYFLLVQHNILPDEGKPQAVDCIKPLIYTPTMSFWNASLLIIFVSKLCLQQAISIDLTLEIIMGLILLPHTIYPCLGTYTCMHITTGCWWPLCGYSWLPSVPNRPARAHWTAHPASLPDCGLCRLCLSISDLGNAQWNKWLLERFSMWMLMKLFSDGPWAPPIRSEVGNKLCPFKDNCRPLTTCETLLGAIETYLLYDVQWRTLILWKLLFLLACSCNPEHADDCEQGSGHCRCKPNFHGDNCEKCAAGYYNFPFCLSEYLERPAFLVYSWPLCS